jgi:hypothetical protein
MPTKMIKLIVVLALGAIICLPGVAGAFIDQGIVFDDWAQQFNESGVGNFDAMECFMVSGGSEWTSIDGFSNGSWSGEIVSPNYVMATGNTVTNLNFNLRGTDVGPPNVFTFDFLAWDGGIITGTLKEHTRVSYNGGWSFAASPADVSGYDRSDPFAARAVVPLPPSVLLFSTGLLGLGFWPRKKQSAV